MHGYSCVSLPQADLSALRQVSSIQRRAHLPRTAKTGQVMLPKSIAPRGMTSQPAMSIRSDPITVRLQQPFKTLVQSHPGTKTSLHLRITLASALNAFLLREAPGASGRLDNNSHPPYHVVPCDTCCPQS